VIHGIDFTAINFNIDVFPVFSAGDASQNREKTKKTYA